MIYTRSQIQKWYVNLMRGVANNKTLEQTLICWKGRFPAGTPKERQFVDAGSATYEGTMLKILVLHPKDHAHVDKAVLEQSLKSMIGLSEEPQSQTVVDQPVVPSPGDSMPVVDSAADQMRALQQK